MKRFSKTGCSRTSRLTRPFEAASKYVPRGVASGLSMHMEILQKLTDEVTKKYEVKHSVPVAQTLG